MDFRDERDVRELAAFFSPLRAQSILKAGHLVLSTRGNRVATGAGLKPAPTNACATMTIAGPHFFSEPSGLDLGSSLLLQRE